MKYKQYFGPFMEKLLKRLPSDISEDDFSEFKQSLNTKMVTGHREHGDGVFDRELKSILGELSFEATDLVGWSVVAFAIIKRDNLSDEIEQQILDIAVDGLINWFKLKKIMADLN